jgi:hypothetical protein
MQQQNKQRQKMNNRPVHVVRYGAIKAAVWQNQTANGPIHNVTLTRSYKEGDEWHETGSFGADDLLAAAKALCEAHTWVFAQRYSDAQKSPPADDVPQGTVS